MKLLVLADLHVDEILDRDYLVCLGEAIKHVGQEAELMIIAGDLTDAAANKWPSALRWLGTLYPPAKTIILPGNHDYYDGNISTLDQKLDHVCRAAGCAFGQCRRLVQGDVRILMTTLWTDMRLYEAEGEEAVADSIWHARQMMPDYGYGVITVGDAERPLLPEDTIALHRKQRDWLMSELARPWGGRTVVVTHHAPLATVAGAMTPLSPCFASDLDTDIDRFRPDAWLFGHTHKSVECRLEGGTLLRNVSIGYENELCCVDLDDRVRHGLIDLGPDVVSGAD